MEKIIALVQKLHDELQQNKGIVPNAWKPYLDAIKFFLNGVEPFVPSEFKVLIMVIIEAIVLLEGTK
jgi:hypothetical protein